MLKSIVLVSMMLVLGACTDNHGHYGVQGYVGPAGATGATGATGANGQDGAIGLQGPIGATGPAGADGTIIVPVQFCPGVAPSYPSTFPESGLCINGNIFAVYSANDGFLALMPPGLYSSNAIGSSCTFTIADNCQIQ